MSTFGMIKYFKYLKEQCELNMKFKDYFFERNKANSHIKICNFDVFSRCVLALGRCMTIFISCGIQPCQKASAKILLDPIEMNEISSRLLVW